jgi:hypothetical protein
MVLTTGPNDVPRHSRTVPPEVKAKKAYIAIGKATTHMIVVQLAISYGARFDNKVGLVSNCDPH